MILFKRYFFLSLTFLFLLSAFSPFANLFPSFLPAKTLSRFQFATIQCGPQTLADSGFSNQLGELKNAILFAAILNRTLIVPPVLHHQAVALGSCTRFQLVDTLTSKSGSSQTRNIDSSTAANTIACDLQRYRTYLNGHNQEPE